MLLDKRIYQKDRYAGEYDNCIFKHILEKRRILRRSDRIGDAAGIHHSLDVCHEIAQDYLQILQIGIGEIEKRIKEGVPVSHCIEQRQDCPDFPDSYSDS